MLVNMGGKGEEVSGKALGDWVGVKGGGGGGGMRGGGEKKSIRAMME